MVRGIGEILGLEADGIAGFVAGTILAGCLGCKIVGGVQVHAGQGGQHLHTNAGLGAGSPGGVAQAAVPDDVALVVAFGLHQSRVVGVDVPAGVFSSVKSIGVPLTGSLRPVGTLFSSASR